jgi:hypothetical protein
MVYGLSLLDYILFSLIILHWRYFIMIHILNCQESWSPIYNWWYYTICIIQFHNVFKKRIAQWLANWHTMLVTVIGCWQGGHCHIQNLSQTQERQITSLRRCNRTITTSKGRLWLRCVLSRLSHCFLFIKFLRRNKSKIYYFEINNGK